MADAMQRRDLNLWQRMQELIAREAESKVRASVASHLMLERKREIPAGPSTLRGGVLGLAARKD